MPRKAIVCAIAAVLAAAITSFVAAPAVSTAEPVRIMPLGDSITSGPGCWRALLRDRLREAGRTGVDFVGSQPGGCPGSRDDDHEGHGGFSATGIADQDRLPHWLAAARPDVVLVHLGTNDLLSDQVPVEAVLTAFDELVDQMRDANPDVRVLVAQVIPMEPAGCAGCPRRVVALNEAIPGWAAGKSTERSPVTAVDQWTGFSAAADTDDGVHPNHSGFRKMADRWYPAVAAALDDLTGAR